MSVEYLIPVFVVYDHIYISFKPLNNPKRDPLEIQHPKFENSSLGFTESVHER